MISFFLFFIKSQYLYTFKLTFNYKNICYKKEESATAENIWTWLQTKGRIFKVISNPQTGIIRVYDEKGNMVMEKKNMSRKQVEAVEESFLSVVAKRLSGTPTPEKKFPQGRFDPMIA